MVHLLHRRHDEQRGLAKAAPPVPHGGAAVEIVTQLAPGRVAAACEQAARAVSEPGRGRRRMQVRLASVGPGRLTYVAAQAGRQSFFVVRIAATDGLTRATLVGAGGPFCSEMAARVRVSDPDATCGPAPAGSQAAAGPEGGRLAGT